MRDQICLIFTVAFMFACKNAPTPVENENITADNFKPHFVTMDKSLEHLFSDVEIDVIAEGFEWSEGPLWIAQENMLLFSDVPENKIYSWTEKNGTQVYLEPSGYDGEGIYSQEQGANGLMLSQEGKLVICQHGNRQVARVGGTLRNPEVIFETIANEWRGKKFNSPNDLAQHKYGDVIFTDPPYGLPKDDTTVREVDFQGVYRIDTQGSVHLLYDKMSRPNGVAFSPDYKTLYVANSDPKNAVWMAFDYDAGTVKNPRVFFDATAYTAHESGLPDGMKVDAKGNVWATGPGGVWIFTEDGEHLGTIKTGQATSNCAFNVDESILYVTADMHVMRIKLKK